MVTAEEKLKDGVATDVTGSASNQNQWGRHSWKKRFTRKKKTEEDDISEWMRKRKRKLKREKEGCCYIRVCYAQDVFGEDEISVTDTFIIKS